MTRSDVARISPPAAGLAAGALAFVLYLVSNHPQALSHDPAEFQTLAATGGIAHAGYPLLVMLLECFGRIPFSTVAWRANLLSCVSGALAVGLATFGAARLTRNPLAAIAAGLALALSMTLWSESTRAGVHAFTLAIDAGIFLLSLQVSREPRVWNVLGLGILCGFGLTSHLTVLSLAPVVIAALAGGAIARRLELSHVGLALAGLALGLAPFGYMIAQDRVDQPMNYIEYTLDLGSGQYLPADTPPLSRLQRAAWLLSARQFLAQSAFRPFEIPGYRLRILAADVALNEFPIWGALLALAGAWWLWRRRRREGALLALWLAGSIFMLLVGAARGMIPIFFLPGAWALSQLIAAGADGISRGSRPGAIALAALLIASPFARLAMSAPPGAMSGHPAIDAIWELWPRQFDPWRADSTWETFGRGVMAVLPARAVVLTRWEEGMTLCYFRYAEPLRTDVDIRLSYWHTRRVEREMAAAALELRPVFATFDPSRAEIPGLRYELLGTWARGRLWRVDSATATP